jgi:hypothetical protein
MITDKVTSLISTDLTQEGRLHAISGPVSAFAMVLLGKLIPATNPGLSCCNLTKILKVLPSVIPVNIECRPSGSGRLAALPNLYSIILLLIYYNFAIDVTWS